MGWVALVAAYPLWRFITPAGVGWLLTGGLAYTGGVYHFLKDHLVPFHHLRWHIFVFAGTVLRWICVRGYALQRSALPPARFPELVTVARPSGSFYGFLSPI